MTKTDTVSADVAVRPTVVLPAHIISPAPLPAELSGQFKLVDWYDSLVNKTPYVEPNPDFMSQRMLMLTLLSATPEQVMTPDKLIGLQELIPNAPGMSSGPVEFASIYVATSDQADGNKTYILFDLVNLDTNEVRTTTTGATMLQAQILTLLALGTWPIRGQIKRTERTDRGGRYLFQLFPLD